MTAPDPGQRDRGRGDPDVHREAIRRALAAKSPEERKETSRKAAETRRRNREAAKGEAPG